MSAEEEERRLRTEKERYTTEEIVAFIRARGKQ
jgi:hypothetical protein